jgi:nucleoid-associated protein YgaU
MIVVGLAAALVSWLFAAPPGCGPKPTSQPADGPAASPPSPSSSADPKPADHGLDLTRVPGRIYLVQQGDTLYSLAERYYGHSKYWRKIWTANRNRLTNPNDLPVGMKLIIPP